MCLPTGGRSTRPKSRKRAQLGSASCIRARTCRNRKPQTSKSELLPTSQARGTKRRVTRGRASLCSVSICTKVLVRHCEHHTERKALRQHADIDAITVQRAQKIVEMSQVQLIDMLVDVYVSTQEQVPAARVVRRTVEMTRTLRARSDKSELSSRTEERCEQHGTVELLEIQTQFQFIDRVVGHSSFSTEPGTHSADQAEQCEDSTSAIHEQGCFHASRCAMTGADGPRHCTKTVRFSSCSSSARSSKSFS